MPRTCPGKVAKMSGNPSSLKIDLITEDPKIVNFTASRNPSPIIATRGIKVFIIVQKKIKILFNSSKHENILS